MIDLDKDIELYKSKVAFYESQNTRGEYAVTVRELKFVVEILEALRSERTSGDCISRELLKKDIEAQISDFNELNKKGEPYKDFKDIRAILFGLVIGKNLIDNAQAVSLPSEQIAWEQGYEAGLAQGKCDRPKGEWAEFEGGYRCSNCDDIEVYTPNFCPNCGADMRTEDK